MLAHGGVQVAQVPLSLLSPPRDRLRAPGASPAMPSLPSQFSGPAPSPHKGHASVMPLGFSPSRGRPVQQAPMLTGQPAALQAPVTAALQGNALTAAVQMPSSPVAPNVSQGKLAPHRVSPMPGGPGVGTLHGALHGAASALQQPMHRHLPPAVSRPQTHSASQVSAGTGLQGQSGVQLPGPSQHGHGAGLLTANLPSTPIHRRDVCEAPEISPPPASSQNSRALQAAPSPSMQAHISLQWPQQLPQASPSVASTGAGMGQMTAWNTAEAPILPAPAQGLQQQRAPSPLDAPRGRRGLSNALVSAASTSAVESDGVAEGIAPVPRGSSLEAQAASQSPQLGSMFLAAPQLPNMRALGVSGAPASGTNGSVPLLHPGGSGEDDAEWQPANDAEFVAGTSSASSSAPPGFREDDPSIAAAVEADAQRAAPANADDGSKMEREGRSKPPPLSISLTRPPPELPEQLRVEYEAATENLGEGAFAIVRELRHRRTGAAVALKVVEKYPLHIRDMLPQLQREVRIQGTLQHRHILRLLSCLEDDTYVYMLLEFCAGGSLRSLCASLPSHRLSEVQASWYFAQVLQGVDFMHQNGCVHRDLKPENMLLTEESQVKICDFGWSAEVQVEQALRTTCGTPHYWAPEIFESLDQGFPVDLWALGTLVYEILVGHAPFWGSMEELRQKVLTVDLRYPPGLLSHEAINLFYCLMQKEPRSRVPTSQLIAEHPWVQSSLRTLASCQAGANAMEKGGSVIVPIAGGGASAGMNGAVTSAAAAGSAAANAASIASAVVAASREARGSGGPSAPVPVPVWSVPGPSSSAATTAPQAGQPAATSAATPAAAVNTATLPAASASSAADEPLVAPMVRPAAAGRGNMAALSAALQPPTTNVGPVMEVPQLLSKPVPEIS